jgi:hypothetical protein
LLQYGVVKAPRSNQVADWICNKSNDSRHDLTRIRRQFAIYFLLHRGNMREKAARWQVSFTTL